MPVSSVSRSYAAPFARRDAGRTGTANGSGFPFPCGGRVTLVCHFEQSLRATNTMGPLSLFAFLAVTQLSRLPILDGLEQEGTVSGILNVLKCNNGRI